MSDANANFDVAADLYAAAKLYDWSKIGNF